MALVSAGVRVVVATGTVMAHNVTSGVSEGSCGVAREVLEYLVGGLLCDSVIRGIRHKVLLCV